MMARTRACARGCELMQCLVSVTVEYLFYLGWSASRLPPPVHSTPPSAPAHRCLRHHRYDLLSVEGFAVALRVFMQLMPPPAYRHVGEPLVMKVGGSVEAVRCVSSTAWRGRGGRGVFSRCAVSRHFPSLANH